MIREKDLPDGWVIKTLKEISQDMHQGINTVTDKIEYQSKGIPIIQSKHITKGQLDLSDARFVKVNDFEEYKFKYNPKKGDILFCNIGTIGKSIVINKEVDFLIAWNLFLIKLDDNVINPFFLKAYLDKLASLNYYQRLLTGGSVKFINKKKLSSIKLPIPPISTQKKIVAILEKAERLKEWRKETDELTDEFLKSTFLEMFYRSNPDYSKWKLVSIKDLMSSEKGSMRTGPFGSDLKHSEFVDTGIAVLGIDNAVNNRFQWGQRRYITEEKYDKLKRYTVYPDDVIVTIMATIGKSCVVPKDIPLSISTKHLAVITCDKTKCDPQFLSKSMLFHPEIEQQVTKANVGAIMDGLNLTIIKSLKIHFPPLTLQQKFASIVQQIEQLREQQSQSRQHIDDLFNVLMQKAFKGELI